MALRVPARLYFRLHRWAVPLIRLFRLIFPVPRSPEPRSPAEGAKLALIPVEAFTHRMTELLRQLEQELPSGLGNYAEFGVYNGTSLIGMYQAMVRAGLVSQRLFGFDSFEGLPPEVVNEDGGVWRPGQFRCPLEVTRENLAAAGVPAARVELVEGWYKNTLREPARRENLGAVSIVMIDSDAYSSAQLALRFIEPVLTSICAIVFDDWKLNDLDLVNMGEYRAFEEFLLDNPRWSAEFNSGYNRKSKITILRLR